MSNLITKSGPISKNRVHLGFFPTPLHLLENLSKKFSDYSIFIKRDDQTGLASGGNKTRKLEYLLQEALEKGCDTVLTAGAQQSNHCRQTAAACAKLGLECHLLLGGHEPLDYQGNLLLSKILGAHIHFQGESRKGEHMDHLIQELTLRGKKCFGIPYGGSNLTGALGFVNAVKELQEQIKKQEISIDYIFFASSSGGMQAGLTLGKELFKCKWHLVPISIDKELAQGMSLESIVLDIVRQGSEYFKISNNLNLKDLSLNRNYHEEGYGVVTSKEKYAIETLARTEGIVLDPVYTARAFYGMLDMLKNKHIPKGSQILFWHTGGLPALFTSQTERF